MHKCIYRVTYSAMDEKFRKKSNSKKRRHRRKATQNIGIKRDDQFSFHGKFETYLSIGKLCMLYNYINLSSGINFSVYNYFSLWSCGFTNLQILKFVVCSLCVINLLWNDLINLLPWVRSKCKSYATAML